MLYSRPKRDEVPGDWRRLHNEELYDLYSSPNIIRVIKARRMIWAGMWHVRETGTVHTGFWGGGPEEKRPFGRPRRTWEDSLKMDVQEVKWGGIDRIDLAQDRDGWWALVNAVMNLRVP
jgi:hypothetical protein